MNNFDPMNPQGVNYNNQVHTGGWAPRSYSNYPPVQPRLSTNTIFVTSLDEALIKTTERPSDIIYFHQDKPEFYRVKVDTEGRKTWAAFIYASPNQEDSTPATKADLRDIVTRIEALEALRDTKQSPASSRKKKEVTENAESDGQRTVFTFDTE